MRSTPYGRLRSTPYGRSRSTPCGGLGSTPFGRLHLIIPRNFINITCLLDYYPLFFNNSLVSVPNEWDDKMLDKFRLHLHSQFTWHD
ncbi:hypothetical protein [Cylindrospermopsis raciborskii]|uniref:hypothetical protein n=1 Tax=Cylindrospermopsis raciborskii TaxID=77022 RepID=UPI001F351E5B|nr:hypothetical protein [Cylindrospermopsis raciborskii]UJS05355.1 hypothetical protein L3I90_03655 [Cylindrospermopsis raciborskii KLL07]